jgi:glycosyltransferase involved in cell wall biosynthesis
VVINSIAKKELFRLQEIEAEIIPNVFDYEKVRVKRDRYNILFRNDFAIDDDDIVALAPVRVIPRKDIRTSIKIVRDLQEKIDKRIVLIISGSTTDVGKLHVSGLKRFAQRFNVYFMIIGDRIAARRTRMEGKRIYTPWDAYSNADFIIYPSLQEGWGNAFCEAIAFKKLIVVRRYPTFITDIENYGFEVVAFNKYSKNVVNRIYYLLNNKDEIKKMAERNLQIAKKNLSFRVLKKKLKKILNEYPERLFP